MILDIKHDLRRKARFVVGGHMIDSSNHTIYSSTVLDILRHVQRRYGLWQTASALFHKFLEDFL
eukprot:5058100-Ditylum_brightwellii.AAC.1